MKSYIKKEEGIYIMVSTVKVPRNSQYKYETMAFPAVKESSAYNPHWGLEVGSPLRTDSKLESWINHYKKVKEAKANNKNFIDFL